MDAEELTMIKDTAERFVAETNALASTPARDLNDEDWAVVVESGWLALAVPESVGGLGGDLPALCVVAEALGRGLMGGAFLHTQIKAALWLAALPKTSQRDDLLEQVMSGDRSIVVADRRPDGSTVAVDDVRVILNGVERAVWCSATPTVALVAAGDVCVVVPLDAPGVTMQRYATVDDGLACDLTFANVMLARDSLLSEADCTFGAVRAEVEERVLVALSAECVGAMRSALERTAEYLQNRKQFGQPLAKLQVLRHRLADMALARLRAEALVEFVAERFERLSTTERRVAVAAAASKALQGLRYVAESAVQLHGGMGVSEESPIGRYLRRSIALEATLGTPEYFRGRYGSAT